MSVFCLLLATSDPLLRHWEAASDLALSFAELRLGDVLDLIEPVDGGVADDPGTAILSAANDLSVAHVLVLLALSDCPTTPFVLLFTPTVSFGSRPAVDRPPRLPESSSQRHARLQRYLI